MNLCASAGGVTDVVSERVSSSDIECVCVADRELSADLLDVGDASFVSDGVGVISCVCEEECVSRVAV